MSRNEYEDGEEYVMIKRSTMKWFLAYFLFSGLLGIFRLVTGL